MKVIQVESKIKILTEIKIFRPAESQNNIHSKPNYLFKVRLFALHHIVIFVALAAKSVQRAPLTFQRVNDVHSSYSFPFGVLGVRYGVANHIFQEDFQNSASFFVN